MQNAAEITAKSAREKAPRDVRLDFFRGLAMFIIFIPHVPDNSWFDFIPARFGFSSAAELFVFCSGLASAFAFGRLFGRDGYFTGARRVLFRIWQVYWAHIGLALVMIVVSIAATRLTGIDYDIRVGLAWFFANPAEGMLRLMTLLYVPNYLDVLPMYLVLLAMIPVVMALARVTPLIPMALLVALWLAVQITGINLPGGQQVDGVWYFNPLAWQLVFFTGFSFGMGWLPTPKLHRGWLFWLCVAVLVASVPVNFWGFIDYFAILNDIHVALLGPSSKTNLNPLLYLHFLASAYVVLVLIDPVRNRLASVRPVVLVGQQALATFMASIVFAWVAGMILDQIGRGLVATSLVNLAGFAGLVLVATIATAYKGGPKDKAGQTKRSPAEAPRGDAVPRVLQPAQ